MKKMKRGWKRMAAIALAVLMVSNTIDMSVFAATATEVSCEHHTEHTEDCGYSEGTEESFCTHEHGEECYTKTEECVHTSHDESCGYSEAQEDSSCTHECSEENGCITMTENCTHAEHDENCGYVEAEEGTPCNYVCEKCADENNVEPPENETAECTCGTDDASIHATNCAVYVAPENPACTCVEKCTEANVWCDVCGFDYTACAGTDEATVYGGESTSGYCGASTNEGGEESVTWTLDDGTLTISGNGDMADYEYNTMPWYSDRGSIKKVKIDDGVTSIGDYAFYMCENANTIEIPEGVTSIGEGAFSYWNSLTTITLPKGVANIGYCAFYSCTLLESVILQEGVEIIDGFAFSVCTALQYIEIPEGVTSIGQAAFNQCKNLESITIPKSVESIDENAFSSCSALTEIKLNCKWKTDIDNGNFYGATNIETVTYTHTMGYSAEGNKLHEGCSNSCGELETITATLSVAPNADLSYTGSTVKPALVMTYPDNWVGEKIVPNTNNCTYSNNTNAGTATGTFTYADGVAVSVNFTIEKATPTFSDAEISTVSGTYGETLADMKLSTPSNNIAGVWSITETDAGSIYPKVGGDTAYEITFMPTDTANYEVYTTDVVPEVEPKELTISVTATDREYEPNNTTVDIAVTLDGIEGSDDVTLNNGNALQGTLNSANADTYTSVTLPTLALTGNDAGNYKLSQSSGIVELASSVVIDKAENVPNVPGSIMNVSNKYEKIGNVPLPDGWEWQNTDEETALVVGTEVTATAIYNGADKDNYKNVSVTIKITRANHDHVESEMLYDTNAGEYAPTCTTEGHGHVKCTIESCGEVLRTNIVVKALGHNYVSSVTKQPTTTEEGTMTYTCSRCKDSYTKPINKLQPSSGGSNDDSDDDSSGSSSTGNTPATEAPAPQNPAAPTTLQPVGKTPVSGPDEEKDILEPFIKGEDGEEGWDVIRDEVKDTDEAALDAPASSEEGILPEIGVEAEDDNSSDATDVSDPLEFGSDDNGSAWWIILLIVILAAAGVAGFVIYSKKNKENS